MDRNVHCQVFHCLASFKALISTPPPLFLINISVQDDGGLASIAVDMAFVITVTSTGVVVAVGAVLGVARFGPESLERYSSK